MYCSGMCCTLQKKSFKLTAKTSGIIVASSFRRKFKGFILKHNSYATIFFNNESFLQQNVDYDSHKIYEKAVS